MKDLSFFLYLIFQLIFLPFSLSLIINNNNNSTGMHEVLGIILHVFSQAALISNNQGGISEYKARFVWNVWSNQKKIYFSLFYLLFYFYFRLSEDREMEAIVNSLEYIDHDSFYAFTRFVDMTSSFWDEESNQNYSGSFIFLFELKHTFTSFIFILLS